MGWRTKLVYISLGLAVSFAGISTLFSKFSKLPSAILLFMAGILLIGQVAWSALINRKFDEKDILSGVSLILGVLTIIAGVIVMTTFTIPLWLGYMVPWVVGVVGLMIIVQGILQ